MLKSLFQTPPKVSMEIKVVPCIIGHTKTRIRIRRHKKKRIDKKWEKKYGYLEKNEFSISVVKNKFYCCQCVMDELRHRLNTRVDMSVNYVDVPVQISSSYYLSSFEPKDLMLSDHPTFEVEMSPVIPVLEKVFVGKDDQDAPFIVKGTS